MHAHPRISVGIALVCMLLAWPAEMTEAQRTRQHGFITPAFDGDCLGLLVDAIQQARREVLVATYYLTHTRIQDALITAANRGANVRIKYEASTASHQTMRQILDRLEERGMEVTRIKMSRSGASMHHKFVVIDQLRVFTGSYNFTVMASRHNYENCVLIESQAVAQDFASVFEQIVSR